MKLETPLTVDVIASGIHDSKNGLFDALARIGAAIQSIKAGTPNDALPVLEETEQAVLSAAERLSKLLSAYSLARHENPVAMVPVDVRELIEDVIIRVGANHGALAIESSCRCNDPWICDRELVADCMVNAVQNALRHARSRVRVEAEVSAGWLRLTVADDGPGFPDTLPSHRNGTQSGVGLFIARRIAHLHERHNRKGELTLSNGNGGSAGGDLGGAVFQLTLP